jgi:hypothetical protein
MRKEESGKRLAWRGGKSKNVCEMKWEVEVYILCTNHSSGTLQLSLDQRCRTFYFTRSLEKREEGRGKRRRNKRGKGLKEGLMREATTLL